LAFGLQRALALGCSAGDPELSRAAELLATQAGLEALESGQSFSVALVGKLKTRMGRQV
jgi:hypothetical protein